MTGRWHRTGGASGRGGPGRRPSGDHPRDVAGSTGPGGVETAAGYLRIGDGWAATLIVAGYPAEVGMSWLEPLLEWPGRLDVAIHIDPVPGQVAAGRLRKQRARLESARRMGADRGRLDDPLIEATAADAADLAGLIARGDSRLFEAGVYLTVHAPTRTELAEAVAEVRAAAASVLLDTYPATWRQLQGWCSTLPLGHDGLGMRRVMDTAALAASFPLASPDLPGPLPGEPDPAGGVLYGVSPSGGIVWWDRWAQDNHNSVVLAASGAGKSYLVKVEILRNLYDGVHVNVIDPEDEYVRLAAATGGTVIQLGAPGVRVNPLDLPPGDIRPDALTRRALFVHTLVAVLLGDQPPPAERAALDRAITAAYTSAGITHDPATWARPAPLLRDLAEALTQTGSSPTGTVTGGGAGGDPAAVTLAARLSPWTEGSFRDLFDGPSTATPAGHLVVWSARHLPDELRAAGMLLALDAVWRDTDTPPPQPSPTSPAGPGGGRLGGGQAGRPNGLGRRAPNPPGSRAARPAGDLHRPGPAHPADERPPGLDAGRPGVRRLVVVDEAWSLMRDREGARFLARMAKSARKRRAGLAVITQDAADLLATDLGQAVVANSATQILMRQAPQAIDVVAATFGLTAGEAQLLLTAGRGQALLLGAARTSFTTVSSATEHDLAADWADLASNPASDTSSWR